LVRYAGEVWRLDYRFRIGERLDGDLHLPAGAELHGVKRIAYACKSNPWRQLSEIDLYLGREGSGRLLGRLRLDLGYLARQEQPLLAITAQQNAPQAVGDLAALALYVARLVLRVHMLSFKPPDRRKPGEEANPLRLFPGSVDGSQEPEVRHLTTQRSPHGDVRIRLTHYGPERPDGRVPVLLIHGFGASGSTFAHPGVQPNLVQCLRYDGRDVWVVDLRTSVAFPTAGHAWELDEVGATDIPAAVDEVLLATGARQVDVIAHCIGSTMFSYAVLRGRLAGKVRRAVLSQVGPVTVFSPANRFRAYLAGYLANYVAAPVLDIRPSPDPGMLERLVDRLLATYPHDDSEWYANNPLLGQRLPQVTMRRRADAIWGQLFELHNLDAGLAGRLDELLGRVNVGNLAQTMHYALREGLTIEQGIGSALDRERLTRYWNFPSRFLFGENNRLFARRGVEQSCRMLAELFDAPGGADEAPVFDCKSIEGVGHQDVLIGHRKADRIYWDCISPFLALADRPLVPRSSVPAVAACPPRLGPVLGWLREGEGGLLLRLTAAPPVQWPKAEPVVSGDGIIRVSIVAEDGDDAKRASNEAVTAPVAGPGAPPERDAPAWPVTCDVLIASPTGPTGVGGRVEFACDPRNWTITAQGAQTDASSRFQLSAAALRARDRPNGGPDDGGLCFALASCQYPAGLLDRQPASRSLDRLASRLESPGEREPQLLFLVGDQIYADETAGLFEPRLPSERYTLPHERLFQLPAARRVVSRLPTYMMLDDHELWDNWEPPLAQRAGDRASRDTEDAGLAFQRYQWNSGPGPAFQGIHGSASAYWYAFRPAGFPVFVMDTRTERDRRVERELLHRPADERTRRSAVARIVGDLQREALEEWLLALDRDDATKCAPKFVVSPSVVFPWSRAFADDECTAGRLDGWDGYPASLKRLLGFIADNAIRNVVFLSGDHHAALFAGIELQAAGKEKVNAYSVVSSGLYAPFPFTNVRARELALDCDGRWSTDLVGGQPVQFDYAVHTRRPLENGPPLLEEENFGVVAVRRESGGWTLHVEFDAPGGRVAYPAQPL
jgi:hypothetical protein